MNLTVLPDGEAAARAVAAAIGGDLSAGGTLTLAGGGTPRRCYEVLRSLDLPWGRIVVLFGDERCVGPHDAESNYRMARDVLLDMVEPATVHRIPGELGAEAAAAWYGTIVSTLRPLDVVLLGVGADGHTASLFPGRDDLLGAGGSAIPVHGSPKPPPDRVSLTLEVFKEARRVYVLTTGDSKRDAVGLALKGRVPAGMVPQAEWFVDEEAAPR